jgi:nitroreductase
MGLDHPKIAKPNHPVLPVMAERWSPYAYDPRPVEREKLLSCLEAARWAPSSYNEQPWTYILAERTDEKEFARALDCLVEGNRAWATNAGVLMLSVVSRLFSKNGKPNRAAEHDMGLAAGNMVLQATALGLQAHQMIGIEPPKVRASYRVPDTHEPLTAIAIGYPAAVQPGTADPLGQRDLTPRARKALSEIVVSGAWGQPAKLS